MLVLIPCCRSVTLFSFLWLVPINIFVVYFRNAFYSIFKIWFNNPSNALLIIHAFAA